MNQSFFKKVQGATEWAVNRRRKRIWKERQRQQRISGVRSWIETIVWCVCVILLLQQFLFQQYVIPSGSMEDTIKIGDRIVVDKLTFGPEAIPYYGKLPALAEMKRGDIIVFVNPDYAKPDPLTGLAQRVLYMLTFGLLDIEKIAYQRETADMTPQEKEQNPQKPPLLVKRGVGYSGDTIRVVDGDLYIRPRGKDGFVPEDTFKEESGITYNQKRNYGFYSAYEGRRQNIYRENLMLNPHNSGALYDWGRSNAGIYVPDGYALPLGDNRDNSRDGRSFGIIKTEDLLARGGFVLWPPARIGAVK